MHRTRNLLARWMAAWWPVLVVSLPIGFAAVRAAAGAWVPIGDDAYFTVRSKDVLTEHHPLVGAWSSGSLDLSTPINNLGPLQLDLLAVFTRWTPMGGTAIGVAVVNIAAVVAIASIVRRTAGSDAVLPAMVAVAALTWTMGSEMLITPRQHQYSILPYLCLLVATWAVARGDRWSLTIAVIAGSLVAQTHLSYPLLVAALAVVMAAGQVITSRAGEATGGRRPLVIAGVLGLVVWSQTLLDQLAGFHNLGHVLFGSSDAGRAGLVKGAQIVAGALVSFDMLLRPGYRRFDAEARLAAPWQSVVFWVLLLAAIGGVTATAKRAGWRPVAGAVVAIVAVIAGVIDAALLPRSLFGFTIGNYRWLWSTGAFVAMLVLVSVWARVSPSRGAVRRALVATGALAVTLPSLGNLPRSVQAVGADRYLAEQDAVASMLSMLDEAIDAGRLEGPVVVGESGMYFGHGYTYPILIELQEHDVEFRFVDPIQERRFGDGRLSDGSERQLVRLTSGDDAVAAQASAGLVAFVAGEPPVALLVEQI
jgi:hypothetical protein